MSTRDGAASRRWLPDWPLPLLLLVVFELAYLVVANFFLHSDWGRGLVNGRPDRLTAAWNGGWTFLPGLVHLRGLDLEGESHRVAWQAALGRSHMLVWLPSLARRHVRVLAGKTVGEEVEVDVLPKTERGPRPTRRGWIVTLDHLLVDELQRVRVGEYALVGEGAARGRFRFQVRGPMQLELARLAFQNAAVESRGQRVAENLHFEARFETGPYVPGENGLPDLVAGTTGALDLTAEVENLGFVSAYLGAVPWLGVSGAGALALDLEVAEGSLLPGSELSLAGSEVEATFFDFAAVGEGRIEGRVPVGAQHAELDALLERFTLGRLSDGATLLDGHDLELHVTNDTAEIFRPAQGIAFSFVLPPAQAPDVAAFGAYLPAATGLALTGGTAELAAEVAYDTVARDGKGWLELSGRKVTATFGDIAFEADFVLDAQMPRADLLGGTVDVSGSRLTVEGAKIVRGGQPLPQAWWARLSVPAGSVTRPPALEVAEGLATAEAEPEAVKPVREPAVIEAEVASELLDTAPLVALLEHRLPKLRWLREALTVPEVELTGHVRVAGPELGLHDLQVIGGKKDQLEILAELDLLEKATHGAVYVRWRLLDAALALNRGDRDWRVLHPRRWYDEAAAAYRAGERGEAFAIPPPQPEGDESPR